MYYKIIKLKFLTEVHFGEKSLDKGNKTIYADSIFSALCHEALNFGETALDDLFSMANAGNLLISDAMPYIDEEFYIPKPKIKIIYNINDEFSNKAKVLKKIDYVPVSKFDDYLKGRLDIEKTADKLGNVGDFLLRQRAFIQRADDTLPYGLEVFSFSENSGLYICVGYNSEKEYSFIETLFNQLSYTGTGGKVSSGLGKFRCSPADIPENLKNRLSANEINKDSIFNKYMSLSICLPKDDELDSALEDAVFLLKRRGGFINSGSCVGTAKKKKELYVFQSGSVFKNRFKGDIYDVASDMVPHKVYRYAKPMFMGV